jgi:hypothetical protein
MRPSPGTVIACTALLVSLGGNAAAITGTITSKNIKNGTIQLEDLSASAQKALRGHRGPRGIPGPRGRTGSPGASGNAGTTSVLAHRVSQLESFKVSLCLDGVLSDVRLNAGAGAYTLIESRNMACM